MAQLSGFTDLTVSNSVSGGGSTGVIDVEFDTDAGMDPQVLYATSNIVSGSWSPVLSINAGTSASLPVGLEDTAFYRLQRTQSASATYRLTFTSDWSAVSHPGSYPANAHFSQLIGVAHNSIADFWSTGSLATPGIKRMAETGFNGPSPTSLQAEFTAETLPLPPNAQLWVQQDNMLGLVFPPNDSVFLEITVTIAHPLVTAVSMVAPSPDWFVGVDGRSMVDPAGGWKMSDVVDLFVYDAGTDAAPDFVHTNTPEGTPQPISNIHTAVMGNSTPIGQFIFTRIN